jgi:hypothetical protein
MKLVMRLAPATAFCLLTTLTTVATAQHHVAPDAPAPKVAARAVVKPPAAAPPAAAPPSPMKVAALAWAKERNLPVREIEVGPPDRRVKRLFVPITSEEWASFEDTFGKGPNRLTLKLLENDNHIFTLVDKTPHLWARPRPWAINGAQAGPRAPALVVDLDDAETQHVQQWFTHRAAPGDALWGQACGHGCMDFTGNIEIAPAADGTNTLRTVSAQEVARAAGNQNVKGGASTKVPMGRKLFDALGIARSKDGRNITYNVIHAASDKVQVIGVPVGPGQGGGQVERRVIRENGRVFVRDVVLHGPAIERFTQMTDEELLGPLPPQGVAGVVRPVQ